MIHDYYDTTVPYQVVDHKLIQYSVCRDFDHISRYKGLRQVVHNPDELAERFVALETPNPFETHTDIKYYTVPFNRVNRLDLIAQEQLGSAQYSWVIAYFNAIEDGFTAVAGQQLKIPTSVTALFNTGEILASVNPMSLNLGEE